MKDTQPVRVRFGVFELDLKSGELRSGDQKTVLREQPLQILRMLVEREGELVAREEIRKKLWPNDTIVEFDHSINAAIRILRRALGDSADEPKYVETLARRGYRLMMRVEWVQSVGDDASVSIQAEPTPPEPSGWIGKKLSHYRVLEIIGGGGMGVVYKAEDLGLGRQVALKFLPEELAGDPAALKRFKREAQTASSLNHPNICTIYQIEEHEGQPFIVMELLEGQTLRGCLASGALRGNGPATRVATERLVDIAIQIADGLEAAHEKGIIHRDIKPMNIFITNKGVVKILDFGLAKLTVEAPTVAASGFVSGHEFSRAVSAPFSHPNGPQPGPEDDSAKVADTALTRTGLAMGTAGYMSPEQVRGEELDARTDLFSFGLVLYEMATGQRAFSGETAAVVHEAVVHQLPAPVRDLNSKLPPELEIIINKALEKDRGRRYQTAAELGSDLKCWKRDSDLGRAVAPRDGRRSRRLWLAASLVTLLAGLAIVGLLWRRLGPSKELAERQLTANPQDDDVTAAAISPDGKYIAYQDRTGFYLRSIDSGETRPITLPVELRNRINHLCWFPGGEKLLADVDGANGELDTWVITILGGAEAHLLYRHGVGTGISPDGRMIAFTTGELGRQWKEVWIGGANGEPPRKLVVAEGQEQLMSPVWSPDGHWIAYGRVRKTEQGSWSADIEIRPANGSGAGKTLVAESGLSESNTLSLGATQWFVGGWSPDWRLLFTVAEGTALRYSQTKYSLWQVRVDPRTGEAAGKPGQLTQWTEFLPRDLTITSDGKHLALLKERPWLDVYLGDLAPDGTSMKTPHRLTLDDRGSEASAWTRDGRAILFGSSRNGRREIFKQGPTETVAEMVVSASGDVYGGQMSPDGSWFLYWESESRPAAATSADSVRLMRRAVGGGSPEMVLRLSLDDYGLDDFACSSNSQASFPCVLGLLEGKDLIFYSLDPLRGEGSQIGKIKVFGAYMGWGLSPDGSSIALVDADKYEGRVELLTLADGTWRELSVEPRGEPLQSVAWAADGKSFFATTYAPDSYKLLHITLAGNAHSLLHNDGRQWMVSPLPSPDGKYLAFRAETSNSNVWMIDNF